VTRVPVAGRGQGLAGANPRVRAGKVPDRGGGVGDRTLSWHRIVAEPSGESFSPTRSRRRPTHLFSEDIAMTSAVLLVAMSVSGLGHHNAEAYSSAQAPSKVCPAPQAPSKVCPAPQAPSKVAPAPQAPAKVSPAPQAPAKVSPAPQAPAKVSPAPQAPAKVSPAPQAPAKVSPAPQAPAKVAPAPQAPAKAAPAPAPQAPAKSSGQY
jgi:hypothetical protein